MCARFLRVGRSPDSLAEKHIDSLDVDVRCLLGLSQASIDCKNPVVDQSGRMAGQSSLPDEVVIQKGGLLSGLSFWLSSTREVVARLFGCLFWVAQVLLPLALLSPLSSFPRGWCRCTLVLELPLDTCEAPLKFMYGRGRRVR